MNTSKTYNELYENLYVLSIEKHKQMMGARWFKSYPNQIWEQLLHFVSGKIILEWEIVEVLQVYIYETWYFPWITGMDSALIQPI